MLPAFTIQAATLWAKVVRLPMYLEKVAQHDSLRPLPSFTSHISSSSAPELQQAQFQSTWAGHKPRRSVCHPKYHQNVIIIKLRRWSCIRTSESRISLAILALSGTAIESIGWFSLWMENGNIQRKERLPVFQWTLHITRRLRPAQPSPERANHLSKKTVDWWPQNALIIFNQSCFNGLVWFYSSEILRARFSWLSSLQIKFSPKTIFVVEAMLKRVSTSGKCPRIGFRIFQIKCARNPVVHGTVEFPSGFSPNQAIENGHFSFIPWTSNEVSWRRHQPSCFPISAAWPPKMASCGPIGAGTPSSGVCWSHSVPFPPQKGSSFNDQHARLSDLRKHSPVLQAYQAYSTTRAREPVLKGWFCEASRGNTNIVFNLLRSLRFELDEIVFGRSVRNRSCNGNERQNHLFETALTFHKGPLWLKCARAAQTFSEEQCEAKLRLPPPARTVSLSSARGQPAFEIVH